MNRLFDGAEAYNARMTRAAIWGRSLAMGVAGSILYGIVHDQISVRISPPYLMDWHPRIIESRDPQKVALAWGVVATWWFGLILGAVLALAATAGRKPHAPWRWIARAVGFIFGISALAAFIALGITRGFSLELPNVFGPVYGDLTYAQRLAFTQVAAMHESSYDAAAISTLVAAGWILWRRGRAIPTASVGPHPPSRA